RLARESGIARRERQGTGQPARHLLRERRTREGAAARALAERLLRDLVRQRAAAFLEALAQPDEGLRCRQAFKELAQPGYRRRGKRELGFGNGLLELRGDLDRGGQRDAGQIAVILARRGNLLGLGAVAGPQRNLDPARA